MDLHELIIKAHARAHAAELAVHAKFKDAAWNELAQLREMLNDQAELEAGGITETPPAEKTQ
ncbi:hypothetical protein ES708_16148 [subsurface metagenome]